MIETRLSDEKRDEIVNGMVTHKMRMLLMPLYNELVPSLVDSFYNKYLDNYLMVGSCIAEIVRIKGENKRMKRRIRELEASLQLDLRRFIDENKMER
jgi:hypothetical protein